MGIDGASSAQHLGMLNFTNNGDPNNNIFGVEFDVFANQEFSDMNANHVGIDVNSLASVASSTAGFWRGKNDDKFKELQLNNGENYRAWIDFDSSRINVTMAKVGMKRPRRPLISELVNLNGVFLDEMFVGFCGATGQLVESHKILAWSFSNSNFSIGDALVTTNLPSFVLGGNSVVQSKGFIAGVSVACVLLVGIGVVVYVFLYRRQKSRVLKDDVEDWETEYWPHRISYQEIHAATNGFSKENVIGTGGYGTVYKGILAGTEVAVKRIHHESENAMREFLAEVSSLGRLKHRNLVQLRGWCKQDKGSLTLVYDYMENGSVDKRIFDCDESLMLSWEERIKVLKDSANGILYLHEGWEAKVLHRDIKASNVLLDKDMNARLGDFGLARIHHHQQELATTTQVVGTVGYLAPEVVTTGRTSTQSDVFGFGVLILEVVCGQRPNEEGKPSLVDRLWCLMERNELVLALDDQLKSRQGYNQEDVERILHLGLLCAHPDPQVRPTMRQVVEILEVGNGEIGELNLLERIRTSAMWSRYNSNLGSRGHPTIKEIKNLSISTSLTNSDEMLEGR